MIVSFSGEKGKKGIALVEAKGGIININEIESDIKKRCRCALSIENINIISEEELKKITKELKEQEEKKWNLN